MKEISSEDNYISRRDSFQDVLKTRYREIFCKPYDSGKEIFTKQEKDFKIAFLDKPLTILNEIINSKEKKSLGCMIINEISVWLKDESIELSEELLSKVNIIIKQKEELSNQKNSHQKRSNRENQHFKKSNYTAALKNERSKELGVIGVSSI